MLSTQVSMQYQLLHEWVWIHEPKVSEKAAHECNNCITYTKECNKIFSIHFHNSFMSFLTQSTQQPSIRVDRF